MGDESADPNLIEWCDKCRKEVEIADEFSDVVQDRDGQRGGWVVQFYCGHSTFTPDGTFYPFP